MPKKKKIIKITEPKKKAEPEISKIEFDESILEIESKQARTQEITETIQKPVREEFTETETGGRFRTEETRGTAPIYASRNAVEESERPYASDETSQGYPTEEQGGVLPERRVGIFQDRKETGLSRKEKIETSNRREYEAGRIKMKKRYPWEV